MDAVAKFTNYLINDYFKIREDIISEKKIVEWLNDIASNLEDNEEVSAKVLADLRKSIAKDKGKFRRYSIARIKENGTLHKAYSYPLELRYDYSELYEFLGPEKIYHSRMMDKKSSPFYGVTVRVTTLPSQKKAVSFAVEFPEENPFDKENPYSVETETPGNETPGDTDQQDSNQNTDDIKTPLIPKRDGCDCAVL